MFNKGFDLYIEGNWSEARAILDQVELVKGMADGPTRSIMEVMKETKFVAPHDWAGYRALTEK